MCQKCVIVIRPDQNRVCRDDGSFILNYKKCFKCNKRSFIHNTIPKKEVIFDDDNHELYEEIITYYHQCKECNHVICEHYYRFELAEAVQEYLMECFLCGRGSDIIPLYKEKLSSSKSVNIVNNTKIANPNITVNVPSSILLHENSNNSNSDDENWE